MHDTLKGPKSTLSMSRLRIFFGGGRLTARVPEWARMGMGENWQNGNKKNQIAYQFQIILIRY